MTGLTWVAGALPTLGATACESGWSTTGVTTEKVGVVFQTSPPPTKTQVSTVH